MATAVIVGLQARKHSKLEEEDLPLAEDGEMLDRNESVRTGASIDVLPKFLQGCNDLPAVQHLDHGQFDLISKQDVEKLFDALGKEKGGQVCMAKLKALLQKVVEPPFSDAEIDLLLADKRQNGNIEESFISAEELLATFHSKNEEVVKFMEARRNKDQQVSREYLQQEVARIVDRDDAFMTLPITLVYISIFMYLVQGHLRIYERRNMENALEEFINGRDPRETADENIDDMDSLWDWILDAGLRGPFANVKNSTDNRFRHCVLASRNVLIGDVKLTKELHDGGETSEWLLNSVQGQAYLKSNPYQYQAAAVAAATHLKNNGWESPDIGKMYMSFNSYNQDTRMFAITEVSVPLPHLGNVYSRIDSSAVSIEPYPSWDLYVADSLFLVLALWIGFQEGRDACAAARMGWGEFQDYWGFWNCVDWVNITLCLLTGIAWLDTITCMLDDSFNHLLSDFKINVDVMTLSSDNMEDITSQLTKLRIRYWMVQVTMAVNTAFVVAKFFKSFQSNARLRVVSTTFKKAFVDLVHFAIMFSTIFLPFVLIGHILFGSDIQEFASVTSAVNTGITCLMGDFAWYVDDSPTFFTSQLPSGMPKMVLMVWYVSFMFLVFLVLLNMLLAVILEHYTEVSGDVHFEADAPAVWTQAMRYREFAKETRGFIPLEDLKNDLENEDYVDPISKTKGPIHPNQSVTVNSLKQAWHNMSAEQAAWLMRMLDDHHNKGAKKEEERIKANHVKHLAEVNKEKLMELSDGVLDNVKRLNELEGVQGGVSDISAGLEKLSNAVTDLNVSVAKVRKEHDRLTMKVDDMMQNIPEGWRLELVEGAPEAASAGGKARELKKAVTLAAKSSTDSDRRERSDRKERSEKPSTKKYKSEDLKPTSSGERAPSRSREKQKIMME